MPVQTNFLGHNENFKIGKGKSFQIIMAFHTHLVHIQARYHVNFWSDRGTFSSENFLTKCVLIIMHQTLYGREYSGDYFYIPTLSLVNPTKWPVRGEDFVGVFVTLASICRKHTFTF